MPQGLTKPTRAPGYYWVRFQEGRWEVAYYEGLRWNLCGLTEKRSEAQMAAEGWKIARRIKEPTAGER